MERIEPRGSRTKAGDHLKHQQEWDIGGGRTAASALPQLTVGRRAVVGAKAAVIGDVPDSATAVGVPARATPGS